MLLQLEPSFNIQTLDELVTTKIVDAIILESEVEHEADQRDAGEEDLVAHEDDIVGMSSTTIEKIKAIEVAPTM